MWIIVIAGCIVLQVFSCCSSAVFFFVVPSGPTTLHNAQNNARSGKADYARLVPYRYNPARVFVCCEARLVPIFFCFFFITKRKHQRRHTFVPLDKDFGVLWFISIEMNRRSHHLVLRAGFVAATRPRSRRALFLRAPFWRNHGSHQLAETFPCRFSRAWSWKGRPNRHTRDP